MTTGRSTLSRVTILCHMHYFVPGAIFALGGANVVRCATSLGSLQIIWSALFGGPIFLVRDCKFTQSLWQSPVDVDVSFFHRGQTEVEVSSCCRFQQLSFVACKQEDDAS